MCDGSSRFPAAHLLQAVHCVDASLLPVLEVLLAAGCRPRTFADVSIRRRGVVQHLPVFDPLQSDEGLQLQDANR